MQARHNGNGGPANNNPQEAIINMRHPPTGEVRHGIDLHLTPTKRRHMPNGRETRYTYQGRCVECHKKTMYVCSGCEDDPDHPHDTFICDPCDGTVCWPFHINSTHI
jgi:hypothetical protein